MSQELSGKVAAITGAASGIGLECAKALLAAGACVVLVERAEKALRKVCGTLGSQAVPLVVDLVDPTRVGTMMERILREARQLGIFHANAGAYVGGAVVEGNPDV